MRILRIWGALLLGVGCIWACGFDASVREYLNVHFWLPFSKHVHQFEKANVRRVDTPYAGMAVIQSTPLGRLRSEYRQISKPIPAAFDPAALRQQVAQARSDETLSLREREEVDLIDAKIDIRLGQPAQPAPLISARGKLRAFLRAATTPEFLSEARGWLAYTHYLLGEQTEAGKIYLDELNRDGSNLSRETLLHSLSLNYGDDGRGELFSHLEEYFDTPEHAVFAIQLVTNPGQPSQAFRKVYDLLEKHADLLSSATGSNALAVLGMRTTLRMGDPAAALNVAAMVPPGAAIRSEPDFLWMLASAHFLSRDYAGAERPLLDLFGSSASSADQKAAAAYGLCGVYWKTRNPVEEIRFALLLEAAGAGKSYTDSLGDSTVTWPVSGWDLSLLLEAEASIETLELFIKKYPSGSEGVKYALAVRLARENRYDEAAKTYESIGAAVRATRMRKLADLYRESSQSPEAKYRLAEFLSANPERIYFNDRIWGGLQNYALYASTDVRLTREEHDALAAGERKLRDDQEERWRAYQILKEIIRDSGKSDLGRKSAQLAIRCLRGIATRRFGRQDEIFAADIELSNWLR